jgi:hypothetical protein
VRKVVCTLGGGHRAHSRTEAQEDAGWVLLLALAGIKRGCCSLSVEFL